MAYDRVYETKKGKHWNVLRIRKTRKKPKRLHGRFTAYQTAQKTSKNTYKTKMKARYYK